MSQIIKPTVGRKVWYRPSPGDRLGPIPMNTTSGQPLDATIIAVWGDRMINVLVTDVMGRHFPVLSCTLLQPGDAPLADLDGVPVGRYCEWMPYQVATAAPVALPDVEAAVDTQDAS